MTKHVVQLSETHLMVYVADEIDVTRVSHIAALCQHIALHFPQLVEIIPSYTSVMLEFHPLHTDVNALKAALIDALAGFEHLPVIQQSGVIELPVYYHPEVAPDLAALADARGLTELQVAEIHSQTSYTVCAIGFAPGFAFLGAVDERIATPRHAEPRLKVAKGSVGIADRQTAVYPADSPGGWQIIGNCPLSLFDPHQQPMTLFQVGDTVRFKPIDRPRFLQLGGQL